MFHVLFTSFKSTSLEERNQSSLDGMVLTKKIFKIQCLRRYKFISLEDNIKILELSNKLGPLLGENDIQLDINSLSMVEIWTRALKIE